ncbi:MAG: RpiB/LacA/LacB family sugar-phosphate isomerase, partial [Bdellovibrionaceae bacterium]|nr:RpiB/LacA/LacB family sugar-phosphate isomerase [Pseudobdellovibrionaceae bacterium]
RALLLTDLGTTEGMTSVDYPDYADKLAVALQKDPQGVGVLVCGSGQGMCMRANRYPHLRAALVWSKEVARLARAHNNANVICLGGRLTPPEEAWSWLQVFLDTPFDGGRHEQRVQKLGLLKT